MKLHKILNLPNGIYSIYWKSGGCSYAAIGMNRDGSRWIAPYNWTSSATLTKTIAKSIKTLGYLG